MADKDSNTVIPKLVDDQEMNLILCEIIKVGWSVEELASFIQSINKAAEPELPHGDSFAVKVLTDALVTLGRQQLDLVERLEDQLGFAVKMKAVDFPIFNRPVIEHNLSKYVLNQ